ncbi:MAG: hypothetical protein ACYC26_06030 [Phycisphaerales bacterium]
MNKFLPHDEHARNPAPPGMGRRLATLLAGVVVMGLFAFVAARGVGGEVNAAGPVAFTPASQSSRIENMKPGSPPLHHIDSDDADVCVPEIGVDHVWSRDFPAAEIAVPHSRDMDFRRIFPHGVADERVFAIALPRSVPTAIP